MAEDGLQNKSRFARLKNYLSLTHENATPIQWEVLALVFTASFASCYSLTFIFPFLPEMTLYFGYAEEDKGYYSGIVASGLFAGRIISSFFWGWLSDVKGRKPVLLICMTLVSITSLLFGFCGSIWMAFALRVLTGMCNGVIILVKTILYEVSDNTNQATYMSIVGLSWGAGIIMGPLISGFLAFPARNFPGTFSETGIFGQFPFLLPSIVAMVITAVWIPLIMIRLPNIKNRRNLKPMVITVDLDDKKEAEVDESVLKIDSSILSDDDQSICAKDLPAYSPINLHSIQFVDSVSEGICYLGNYTTSTLTCDEDVDDFMGKGAANHGSHNLSSLELRTRKINTSMNCSAPDLLDSEHRTVPLLKDQDAVTGTHNDEDKSKKKKNMSLLEKLCETRAVSLLKIKDVRDSVAVYSLMSFAAIGYDECFTVFSSTSTKLDGLGFRPDEIGAALGLSSTPLIVIQVFLFPFLEKRLGTKRTFEIFCVILIFVTSLMICFRAMRESELLLWGSLLTGMGIIKICQVTCFTATSLLINNSVTPDLTGSVNGIGMTITAILRTLAPTVGGSIFAWSITSGVKIGFPFDINLVFLMFSFVYLLSNIVIAQMSPALDKQMKVQCNERCGKGEQDG